MALCGNLNNFSRSSYGTKAVLLRGSFGGLNAQMLESPQLRVGHLFTDLISNLICSRSVKIRLMPITEPTPNRHEHERV